MTISRSRPRAAQRWLGLAVMVTAATALVLSVASGHNISSIPGNYFTVNDSLGANDVPGQVDLTRMGRDDSSATSYKLFWSWDSTDQWTGTGQTGDACALFDTNADAAGNINFVICVRINNPGADPNIVKIVPNGSAGPVFLFSCSDKKNDRCTNPSPVAYTAGDAAAGALGGSLDPTADLVTHTDPFPLVGSNTPHDSSVAVEILKSKIPGNEVLVNVCSYPSAGNGGNNNPFDCIVNPGAGFLKIVKDAGTDSSTAFDFVIAPAPLPPASANQTIIGSGNTANLVMSIASNYSVTETVPTGWTLSSSGCSISGGGSTGTGSNPVTSIAIVSGQVTTCTFTNAPIQPKLTVTKIVTNNSGGQAQVSDFPLFIDGNSVTSGVQNDVSAGSHTVSETGMTGYVGTIGGDCAADGSITLAYGDVKACTITNDDQPASLTVTKIVTNDNGGQAQVSDFPLFVDGNSVTSGAANEVNAGSHTVSETGMTGYTGTIGGDCAADGSITLDPGESGSCTITNDDQPASLTVTKIVVTDDGGTAQVSDFPLFIDGNSVTSGASNEVSAGSHTVSETGMDGYAATIGGDCAADGSITLGPGESGSCTITNDDQPATLTVTKIVDNDFGGGAVVSDFPLFIDGVSVTSGASNEVSAGSHTVSETNDEPGYTGVIGGDCAADGSITLDPGESGSCTITNSDSPAAPSGSTVQSWVLHDSLSITGIRHGAPDEATATVTFRLWNGCAADGTGSDQEGSGEAIDLALGDSASTEDGVAVADSGTYYWTAEYSGDAWNLGFETDCNAEVTQILAQDASHNDPLEGLDA